MKRFDGINVIPLIDVMLVLLAIVLTTATFIVQDKLDITLPKTENTQSFQPNSQSNPVTIAINAQNQVFIDENPIALNKISNALVNYSTEQTILLRVDQKTEFGRFTQVVDALKLHKLENLTILTDKK